MSAATAAALWPVCAGLCPVRVCMLCVRIHEGARRLTKGETVFIPCVCVCVVRRVWNFSLLSFRFVRHRPSATQVSETTPTSVRHYRKNSTMSERKAVIKNADMSDDMQQDAIDCATQALEKFNIEKDIAAFIKKEFDKKYNPTWHCIVGRNFGSYVTHETKHFIYFYLGQIAVLLFKSG